MPLHLMVLDGKYQEKTEKITVIKWDQGRGGGLAPYPPSQSKVCNLHKLLYLTVF
jgi:hypothetical protein